MIESENEIIMTAFRGFRLQTLLFISVLLGLSYAGFCCKPGKGQRKGIKQPSPTGGTQNPSSYGASTCTMGTPQLPNYLQPVAVDPKRFVGKWYDYQHWYIGIMNLTSYNAAVTYTNLLDDNSTTTRLTLLPGSNTQAVLLEQLYSKIKRDTNLCRTIPVYISYLTLECQFTGTYYNGPSAIFVDAPSVLSIDYDNYVMFYMCDAIDTSSGLCLEPTVYVQTRMQPDQVTTSLATTINNAANQILSRYCFDASLFWKSIWQPDAPECPFRRPTDDCYTSLLNGYRYLGDPNFSV